MWVFKNTREMFIINIFGNRRWIKNRLSHFGQSFGTPFMSPISANFLPQLRALLGCIPQYGIQLYGLRRTTTNVAPAVPLCFASPLCSPPPILSPTGFALPPTRFTPASTCFFPRWTTLLWTWFCSAWISSWIALRSRWRWYRRWHRRLGGTPSLSPPSVRFSSTPAAATFLVLAIRQFVSHLLYV